MLQEVLKRISHVPRISDHHVVLCELHHVPDRLCMEASQVREILRALAPCTESIEYLFGGGIGADSIGKSNVPPVQEHIFCTDCVNVSYREPVSVHTSILPLTGRPLNLAVTSAAKLVWTSESAFDAL